MQFGITSRHRQSQPLLSRPRLLGPGFARRRRQLYISLRFRSILVAVVSLDGMELADRLLLADVVVLPSLLMIIRLSMVLARTLARREGWRHLRPEGVPSCGSVAGDGTVLVQFGSRMAGGSRALVTG